MIIVKTKKGDVFVNEKEIQVVQHDRENKWVVIRSHKEGPNCVVRDVEGIKYIFGHKSRYGDFDEIIIAPKDVDKIKKVVEWLETDH